MPAQLIPSFNAGELSPYLDARSDLDKYASGCRLLENNILMPYGGVYRRPGTEYRGPAKNANKRCRLLGFNFSTTTRFVIEMGEQYLRFWSNGVLVEDPGSPGNPLEVVTPYLEAELRDVQFIQINDVMYFVHPAHVQRKLSRVADNNWTFQEIDWDWPALLDENIEATTLTTAPAVVVAWITSTAYTVGQFVTQSGSTYRCLVAHTSGTFATDLSAAKWELVVSFKDGESVVLTASTALFEAGHVGSYWQIGHARATAFVEMTISAVGSSQSIAVLGSWEFNTYGTWEATMVIERSYDGGATWEIIRSYRSKSDFNAAATGKEEKEALLRIRVTAYTSNTGARAMITVQEAKEYGVVKVTSYTDSTHVTAEVVNDLAGTAATKYWSEGAWSTKQGFPRTVALHEQRVWYGATARRPQSIWGSVSDDFENFRLSTNDDAGLFFTLSAQEANPIQWLLSQDRLLIGTAGDEWTVSSSDTESALSPTNVKAARQASFGSKYLRALILNDVILFVQRQGRKVRELVYSFEVDGWRAPDLTVLSEHVTEGEIVEAAFQQQPDAIYWTITGQGQLVGMTYERDQNVVGWHRHTTDGLFESVATIYGANGPDEVWLSVKREIDGQTVRYIERFAVDFRSAFETQDKSQWWYLDCAKRVTMDPKDATVSGLEHLEGKEVDILADGAVSPSRTVEGGEIELQAPAGTVLAGLPYVSRLKPMKLEMQMQDGASRGRRKRIHRMSAAIYKSLGGQFSSNGVEWDWIYSRTTTDPMDDSPPVFTGDKEVYVAGDTTESADIELRQTQPMPLTILAITVRWDAYGD